MADPEKAVMDVEDQDSDDVEQKDKKGGDAKVLSREMMKNPDLLTALQGQLLGTPSGYIQSLPVSVKRRLKALKKIQFEATKIEAKFYEQVYELECKYHHIYTTLYEKRTKITRGLYEPDDNECDWPSDEDDDVELAGEVKDKVQIEDGSAKENVKKEDDKDLKGIPEFWLTIFKNVDMLQEMVQEHDEPALAALYDIKVSYYEGNVVTPMGFKLHFLFDSNDYFTNTELTKNYVMKCDPSEDDPFSFDGPEIYNCTGCPINWKPGKNLTVKTVKKKQKHKSKGNVRTITKQVKNDSFFNFFDPPSIPEDDEEELDEETQSLLTADFEIGHYIRERIVPRAVLFFTGEALEDDEFDEDEEEEGEGEEDEDDDDPDYNPAKDKAAQSQDCKQQ